MKLPIPHRALVGVLLVTVSTCLAADQPPARPLANATNAFTVSGMHCNGCARGLASELSRARGVASATVSLTNRLAVVAYDTNRTSAAKLVKVIEEAGFKAKKVNR